MERLPTLLCKMAHFLTENTDILTIFVSLTNSTPHSVICLGHTIPQTIELTQKSSAVIVLVNF